LWVAFSIPPGSLTVVKYPVFSKEFEEDIAMHLLKKNRIIKLFL
jgi:hypothetical protein